MIKNTWFPRAIILSDQKFKMNLLIFRLNKKMNRIDYSTDEALVNDCLQGMESAWTVFQERYNQFMYAIVCRQQWRFNRDDVEDIMEDVYVILIEKGLRLFKFESSLKTYIATIARRVCLERIRLRRDKERPTFSFERDTVSGRSFDDVLASGANVVSQVMDSETAGEINSAFNQLKGECKKILRMRYREEMAYDQIAQHLNMPLGTVCSMVARCTEKLVELIKPIIDLPVGGCGGKR